MSFGDFSTHPIGLYMGPLKEILRSPSQGHAFDFTQKQSLRQGFCNKKFIGDMISGIKVRE